MGQLRATVRTRSELGRDDVARMYALYDRYYDAVSPERFAEDLAGKRWIIELSDGVHLRGFSTVTIDEFVVNGRRRRAIFSGDTIVDHRFWGEQALSDAFCALAGSLKAMEPGTPLYWFLISKGYRTFRYLRLFSRRYFPHPVDPTPPEMANCLDTLAQARFGTAWHREQGLVRFGKSHGHLKPEWAGVRSGLQAREEIGFFLQRNPGYVFGDELACITELAGANLRARAARTFEEALNAGPSVLPGDH